jgi:hypothetical protein
MNTTVANASPLVVSASRPFAAWLGDALGWLHFWLGPVAARSIRAIEAGALRRHAAELESRGNGAFAADLYAAADRHQPRA